MRKTLLIVMALLLVACSQKPADNQPAGAVRPPIEDNDKPILVSDTGLILHGKDRSPRETTISSDNFDITNMHRIYAANRSAATLRVCGTELVAYLPDLGKWRAEFSSTFLGPGWRGFGTESNDNRTIMIGTGFWTSENYKYGVLSFGEQPINHFRLFKIGDGKKVTVIEYENPGNNRFKVEIHYCIDLTKCVEAQIPKCIY